jgi:alpha-glucosidase
MIVNYVFSEHDLITVGETPFTHDASELAPYVLPANKELNMVFQFEIMNLDSPMEGQDIEALKFKEWKLSDLKDLIGRWQRYKRDEDFWNA